MIDLDKLEELAKAATPGPWQSFDEEGECYSTPPATGAFLVEYGASVDQRMKDVHFIASANPAAVLALIADHRAALARIAKVEALHQPGALYAPGAFYAPRASRMSEHICGACLSVYPCVTVRALTEGENE